MLPCCTLRQKSADLCRAAQVVTGGVSTACQATQAGPCDTVHAGAYSLRQAGRVRRARLATE